MTTTQEAGKKGAQVRNENLGPEGRSEAARKAAETRKEHNPDAFKEMGQKGGKAHGSQASANEGGQAQSGKTNDQSSSSRSSSQQAEGNKSSS